MHVVRFYGNHSPGSRHATQAKLSKYWARLMAEGDDLQMQLQNVTAAGAKHVSYLAFSASLCIHPQIIIVPLCIFIYVLSLILFKVF